MKLKKTNVLGAAIGSGISAFLLAAGPHPTNVALEMSIFVYKCAFVLFMVYTCMEKEQ